MTPADISALIHYYVSPEPRPFPNSESLDVAEKNLSSLGLIAHLAGKWRTTPKGAAHIMQICNLPLPVQGWIGADGKVLDSWTD